VLFSARGRADRNGRGCYLAGGSIDFTIINTDAVGVGFNDPTPATPVGGNTGTTIGQQRLIAFQFAANIWGTFVASNVTIQVSASFAPLACSSTSAILGSAGPFTFFRDFTGAPVAATWYAVALANALHGSDLDPSNPDVTAQFNGAIGTTCSFPIRGTMVSMASPRSPRSTSSACSFTSSGTASGS
jgi:hypothetical protein